ncbi:MAG: CPBP family intramembrane metalloprotease [Candidatus Binatia bacterium]|nr:CPBP family intramembrane metalloprotease [Candidatus Binatia bacterium]
MSSVPTRFRPALAALLLLAIALPLALWSHISAVWIFVPLLYLLWNKRDLDAFGLTLEGIPGLRFHAAVLMLVFVPYLVGHYGFGVWYQGQQFSFRLPDNFARLAADHLLGVGLSEEFFFRAYMQTEFDRVWPRRWQWFGARCGPGLLYANALFALCHVFNGGPGRLIVFFPGLLYGWLWARTTNLLVPAFYHGFSNILMSVMLASLQPA